MKLSLNSCIFSKVLLFGVFQKTCFLLIVFHHRSRWKFNPNSSRSAQARARLMAICVRRGAVPLGRHWTFLQTVQKCAGVRPGRGLQRHFSALYRFRSSITMRPLQPMQHMRSSIPRSRSRWAHQHWWGGWRRWMTLEGSRHGMFLQNCCTITKTTSAKTNFMK